MASIEVVYVPVDQIPVRAQVTFVAGMTVADVLENTGLLKTCPELSDSPVGIFSRRVDRNTLVKAGDRVEIYRPLDVDPMEKRRQRAHRRT